MNETSRTDVHLRLINRFKNLLVCGVLLFAACSSNVNDSNHTPVVTAPPSTTFPMPPLSGKSVGKLGWHLADGQHNIISQYEGSVLVLDFYATWCEPCRQSVPVLVELQQRFKDKGLHVVGLNVGGPDDWPKVNDFARDMNIQYTLAVPEEELNSLLLGENDAIPQTFVFDRHGNPVKRIVGFRDASELEDAISSAVESK